MNKDLNKKEIENTIKSLDKLIKEAKKQAVYTKICFYLSVVSVLIVVFEGCLNTSNNIINKIDVILIAALMLLFYSSFEKYLKVIKSEKHVVKEFKDKKKYLENLLKNRGYYGKNHK